MTLSFNRAKFLWNHVENTSVKPINEFAIVNIGPENDNLKRLRYSDGACVDGWPESAPRLLGQFFATGFASVEIEGQFILEILSLEDKPEWLEEFLRGWVLHKDDLNQKIGNKLFNHD